MSIAATRTTKSMNTRASSQTVLGIAQDENKIGAFKAVKAGDKKKVAAVPKQRAALGDISNAVLVQQPSAKEKVAAGAKRVNLLGNKPADKPVASSLSTSVSALPKAAANPLQKSSSSVSQALYDVPAMPAVLEISHMIEPAAIVPVHAAAPAAKVDAMVIDEAADDEAEDIDLYDQNDPLCCTEYVNEIFEYCREKERSDAVSASYMSRQVDINEKMRGILIDWMVEVHVKFKLLTETMFLSVAVIDRYLSMKPVARNKLQLVGITAMLIAAKYEEIFAPEVRDFDYISDKAYTREEILKTERLMLSTLNFNLSTPTPLHFLRRFSKAARSNSRTHTLSKYLTELTLTEYKMVQYLPSVIAAAAVYIARCMTVDDEPWTITLEKYTTYSEEDILACARDLNEVLYKASTASLKATRKKYLSAKLLEVAKIPCVEI